MYCVDTTFLIDLFNAEKEALALASELEDEEIATTHVNVFEFMSGVYHKKNERLTDAALRTISAFTILDLDTQSTLRAAQINASLRAKGKPIDSGDCLTAGISLSHNCHQIVTRNKKHFEHIEGVEVVSY